MEWMVISMSGIVALLAGLAGFAGIWVMACAFRDRRREGDADGSGTNRFAVRVAIGGCLVAVGLFGVIVGVGSVRDLFTNDDVSGIMNAGPSTSSESPFESHGPVQGADTSGKSESSSGGSSASGSSSNDSYSGTSTSGSGSTGSGSSSGVASNRWLNGTDSVGGPVTSPIAGRGDEDMTGEAQVREADVKMSCADFDSASSELTSVMANNGAVATIDETVQVDAPITGGASVPASADRPKAMQRRVHMRVPAENLDALIQGLRDCKSLEVESATTQALDMTAARNENARRREELQVLYDEAKAELDACDDDTRRKSLEGRVASLEARLKEFDEVAVDVDMSVRWSTVTAVLSESFEGDLAAKHEFEQALGDVPRSFEVGLYRIGTFVLRNFVVILLVVVGCVVGVVAYRRTRDRKVAEDTVEAKAEPEPKSESKPEPKPETDDDDVDGGDE